MSNLSKKDKVLLFLKLTGDPVVEGLKLSSVDMGEGDDKSEELAKCANRKLQEASGSYLEVVVNEFERYLTDETLDALIAFYSSEHGRNYMASYDRIRKNINNKTGDIIDRVMREALEEVFDYEEGDSLSGEEVDEWGYPLDPTSCMVDPKEFDNDDDDDDEGGDDIQDILKQY